MGPAGFAEVLNRFYGVAEEVLIPQRAVIDKMIGDEVMSFFIPPFEPDYRRPAGEVALQLQRALLTADDGIPLLPVGIGVHAGSTCVGKVGTDVSDFTANADTISIASRLQSIASAGEVAISEELADVAPPEFDTAERRTIKIRGREQGLVVWVLKVG